MGDRDWPAYQPDGGSSPWGQEPSVSPGTPILPVPYRSPQGPPPPPPPGGGRRLLTLLIGVLVVSVVGIVAIVAVLLVSDGDDSSDEGVDRSSDSDDRLPDVPTPVTPDLPTEPDVDVPTPPSDAPTAQAPDSAPVLSAEGFGLLVEAVEGRGGGTQVFSAVVYPEYAVVDVPLDRRGASEQGLRWDGEGFDDFGAPDSATTERVDLAAVDADLLVRLVRRAERLLEGRATTTYVIIEGASTVFSDDGTRIRAYASNLSESAYVATRLDGTLVRKYVG